MRLWQWLGPAEAGMTGPDLVLETWELHQHHCLEVRAAQVSAYHPIEPLWHLQSPRHLISRSERHAVHMSLQVAGRLDGICFVRRPDSYMYSRHAVRAILGLLLCKAWRSTLRTSTNATACLPQQHTLLAGSGWLKPFTNFQIEPLS